MKESGKILKKIAILAAAAFMVVPSVAVLSACGPVEKEEEVEPPIEEEIDPEQLVYNEDGFNREGFVEAFNDLFENYKIDNSETYDHYLNARYGEFHPLFAWNDANNKTIYYATFGKFLYPTEKYSGEFRIVSFNVDLDSCKTWDEFKEKFLGNVKDTTIGYPLFESFDHMAGGEVIEDLDKVLMDIAREHYNETYSDYNTIQNEAFFFGLAYKTEDGKMCYPVGTIALNDKNELEFMGAYVYAENEEELVNGNFEVGPANAERQIIARYDDTYCNLTYLSRQN